jgi:hypothetical protein
MAAGIGGERFSANERRRASACHQRAADIKHRNQCWRLIGVVKPAAMAA